MAEDDADKPKETPQDHDDALDDDDDVEVVVDASQPTTQMRIAIPGRAPLTCQFNTAHTVRDIRRHLRRVSPLDRPYHLHTLRPPRRLLPAETIAAAGLQQSSITVVFKTV